MSIFRSENMALCQLFLSSEASYNCVSELGEIGLVQFRDLNPNVNMFQRKFVHEIRRCEEMERKLRYLQTEANRDNIKDIDIGENPDAPQPREMIDLEATFEKLENELREVNANSETLKRNFLDLTELKYVLESSQAFFEVSDIEASTGSMRQSLIPTEEGKGAIQFGFVAGVIPRQRMAAFERMLWRVCRGNVFVRQDEIDKPLEDPSTHELVNKIVYLIFFQGEQLKNKVKKICEGCRSTMYPCPETQAERHQMLEGVTTRMDDLSLVLQQTTEHRHRVLAAASKHLHSWFVKVRKLKGIYHTLNVFNFDVTNECLIAEAWIPEDDLPRIKSALMKGTERSGSTVEPIVNKVLTKASPPTFHRVNKFTRGFQALINAYGVASYREVNPGLYTTITFPFLFAVMFGDAGHGLLMLSFALWMVIKEKQFMNQRTSNEIWKMFFNGRYIILLMGCFSVYTGFMYNDVYSKSVNIFGSSFHVGSKARTSFLQHNEEQHGLDPGDREDYEGYPYPFGLDPIWQLGLNKISFFNSYKMKISIILGVLQMVFGVVLSLFNSLYFKKPINIFCEFIPQLIFMLSVFGYLCILVLYKYLNYGAGFDFNHDTRCAPSVLILFIDMVLFKLEKPVNGCESAYLFNGQYTLQKILVIVAAMCVPIMLIPKPFLLRSQHKKKMQESARTHLQGIDNQAGPVSTEGAEDGVTPRTSVVTLALNEAEGTEEEEFEFSEAFIHQSIHTIEYVLGTVSHTASYLRLWALSLAHAQLSEVLWMMVLRIGISQSSTGVGSIMLYLIFAAWAFLTVSILVVMEGLSAFLHCLRLHWVEFCSKFYEAQGYLFTPFKFSHYVNVDNA